MPVPSALSNDLSSRIPISLVPRLESLPAHPALVPALPCCAAPACCPARAQVLVAKSELYSAQAEYDKAVECLFQAYTLREAQLGSNHKQIGKLFSALGTIRQKQVRALSEAGLRRVLACAWRPERWP